jgi:hypothetical protein
MTRPELEHAIRAACDVSGDDELYVFGSQAILGQYPDAPDALRQSAEADVAPVHAVDMADVIDAQLGELSPFHHAFGFYVHGLSIDAAILPSGWQKRAIAVRNDNTRNKTGWCVEAHDLAASKLVAFREKDKEFVRVLIVEGLIKPATLRRRLSKLPDRLQVTEQLRHEMDRWIRGVLGDITRRRVPPGKRERAQ